MGHYYRVDPGKLRRNYKRHSSGFDTWDQAGHAGEYLLYPANVTPRLAIDEVSLSQGELYTIVSSRDRSGRKGKLIGVVAGTKAGDIAKVLLKIPLDIRRGVNEVSMDMAPSMKKACREAFPLAVQVTDRFHVVRLVMEAMQHVRIDQRWKEIDRENEGIRKARKSKKPYLPVILANGDTAKQLLARSRYLLYKRPDQWTRSQIARAALLFKLYPKIEQAYRLSRDFRNIYEHNFREKAIKAMGNWTEQTKKCGLEQFNSVAESIESHREGILNFFNHRSTNAHAESFNAQVKLFRSNLRGVTNVPFFMFRLEKLFA